jgi:hypothetical protein
MFDLSSQIAPSRSSVTELEQAFPLDEDLTVQRRGGLISSSPSLIFEELDGQVLRSVVQVPSSMYEVLMVLLALYSPHITTALLDEPGKNLHPSM